MMSRQWRLLQLPLVSTILACLLVGLYLFACKLFSKPDPSAAISSHSVDTESDKTLEYWTMNKMRHAKPADLPHIDDLDRGKQHPRRPPSSPQDSR